MGQYSLGVGDGVKEYVDIGEAVGDADGVDVVGNPVGAGDGIADVGTAVGDADGVDVAGNSVGAGDGLAEYVGVGVGETVGDVDGGVGVVGDPVGAGDGVGDGIRRRRGWRGCRRR